MSLTNGESRKGKPYTSKEEKLLSIRYRRLLIEAEKHILNYVQSNGLDEFKYLFWSFDNLSDDQLDRVNTPRDLFHTLEEIGELSIRNTKVLKVLAEDLKLKELKEEVKGYELHSAQGLAAITSYMETVLKTNPDVVAVIVFCVLFSVVPKVFSLPLILIAAYLVSRYRSVPLPNHWEPQPKDTNGKEKDLHLVPLDPVKQKQEYDQVNTAITKTIGIVKIERVQNPELYRVYMVRKQWMDDNNGGNEKKLFHGTPVSTCTTINHKGFNRSFCGKNATVYGKGVYFARDATYSMHPTYSPPDSTGNRCMYLASVLVGEYTLGNSSMIAPPPKNPTNSTITYDSTVNNVNNPSVFVAFHDNQVYPDYLITFK